MWALVREDPKPAKPPKPKRLTSAERVAPFLEVIAGAASADWHRVGLFSSGHSAGQTRSALAKAYPEGWEWKAARDGEGRPAVFVRRLGTGAG